MKRKILITVTDLRRFYQFRLGQVARWLFLGGTVALLAGFVIGWLYVSELEDANYQSKRRQKALKELIALYEQRTADLEMAIARRQAALERLGDRLGRIEAMVSRPDGNETFVTRLDNVTLTAAQLALLFAIVPNGEPLPMKGVTSAFGWRHSPLGGGRHFHMGIDLRAKRPTPVWTTADGVVEFAGYSGGGFGKLVIVNHGFGFKTYYGHLAKVSVRKGDTVVKGDILGLSGNTGRSTAPHLHYEIRFLGRPLNPYWFMRWQKRAYRSIFQHVKGVPWESFIALVSHMASQTLPVSSPPAAP